MQSDQYKREIASIQRDIGKIRADIGKEEENARKARTAAASKRTTALRSSSQSIRDSYNRQAESEVRKVETAEKKIGALQAKMASTLDRLSGKERSLQNAERNEQAARNRAEDQRRRKEKSNQDAKDRADARRRLEERNHAREIARINRPTIHHVFIKEPEPEKLRVLYLTASPATPNLDALRVDAEVNNVLKALRSAKHKDLVELQHRPAATMEDLVDGINDHRPHVVHFSGHADGGLLFDTADPIAAGDQLVGYEAVARVLAATDHPPTLIVLNACRTAEAVEQMLEAAPVVIATNDTVGDASSAIFATHFYGAIAAAQTIGHAVVQAREMIAIALPDEPDVIRVSAVEGVAPEELQLVRPT
ncbi:CHAT domain-containing protein [Mesorhizobium amorphae]|uniref:CHAT domain-containing protein n=1 Tax=Mesorhizobium amorphae TaxID=71433 RepID=UPI003ED0A452